MRDRHHSVVIIGGGTAGITVAARLRRAERHVDIAIIEPSDYHYYQPMWTLVGGGVVHKESSRRPEVDYIPRDATWIRDAVEEMVPDENYVVTRGGMRIGYDWLVVAPGIQIDWHLVKGLCEALGRDGVCSTYSFDGAATTWEFLRDLERGEAVFTMPGTPVKCAGAPQKIMWLAHDHLVRTRRRADAHLVWASADAEIFGVPRYRSRLDRLLEERDIDTRWNHDLIEVRPATREAIFLRLGTCQEVALRYDFLHVVPPMSAPDFVERSPLADPGGWVDVDPETLRHVRYGNVFSLGDASNLPTSKSGAAVRRQAPILVRNLRAAIREKPLPGRYDGYTSCPLVTGYGRLILAEFDYDRRPAETFPFDQSKERWSMYQLNRRVLPALYWSGMLRGH